ncbi:MAG: hypothetical protein ACREOA_08650 [Candidatus Dormibacteria bacterium]
MNRSPVLGIALALTAAATGLAACGGGTAHGTLKASGTECKASYTVQGSMVTVRVKESGPATVKAIVTDTEGNRHGATTTLKAGDQGATLKVSEKPPVRRVQVRVSEPSGQTNCLAS